MGGGGGGHCTRPLLPNGTGHKTARAYENWGNFRSGAEEFRLVQCLKNRCPNVEKQLLIIMRIGQTFIAKMSKRRECDGCLNGIPSRALPEKKDVKM